MPSRRMKRASHPGKRGVGGLISAQVGQGNLACFRDRAPLDHNRAAVRHLLVDTHIAVCDFRAGPHQGNGFRWQKAGCVFHRRVARPREVGSALVAAERLEIPPCSKRGRVPGVDSRGVELAEREPCLASQAVTRRFGADAEHAVEGAHTIERAARAPHELDLLDLAQSECQRSPVGVAHHLWHGGLSAIDLRPHATVHHVIESARVDVEVVQPALCDVNAWRAGQQQRQLAAGGLPRYLDRVERRHRGGRLGNRFCLSRCRSHDQRLHERQRPVHPRLEQCGHAIADAG